MDPSLLLPKLKLTTLFILLFNTFFPFSSACTKNRDNLDFLPTEGTKVILPFVNTLNSTMHSRYTGDSYSMPNNKGLADLLDIGYYSSLLWWTLNDDNGTQEHRQYNEQIPPLDGKNPTEGMWNPDDYSMKFVAYDIRLGKLQAVNPLDMSFNVELQIFLQWQEWLTKDSEKMLEVNNETCMYFCDNTHPNTCCDKVWVPTLRLPNADVTQMDSIMTFEKWGPAFKDLDSDCIMNQTTGANIGDSNCYYEQLWELSVEAKSDANMNFRNFPFDVQKLSIDIRNPYSSRTWFQLAPGSLEQSANNLVQQLSTDAATLGWSIIDVIVSPLCDVLTWNHTFLALDKYLFKESESQAKYIQKKMHNSCPKLCSWSPNESIPSYMDTSMYDGIIKKYSERLNYTQTMYINCVVENGEVYSGPHSNYIDFWINVSDPRFNNKVSLPCLFDAIQNLTTPGIKVTILVKRYTEYYILKLVIPMIACVGFAFTAVAINVKDVANRLMVVIPAAIALTALQVTVVATDIPAVSYIVPTTWLMILSYLIQLLIAVESMAVYKLGFPYPNILGQQNSSGQQDTLERPNNKSKWKTRKIDFLLMGMLFILYTMVVFSGMLIHIAKINRDKADLLSNGFSIWNPNQ